MHDQRFSNFFLNKDWSFWGKNIPEQEFSAVRPKFTPNKIFSKCLLRSEFWTRSERKSVKWLLFLENRSVYWTTCTCRSGFLWFMSVHSLNNFCFVLFCFWFLLLCKCTHCILDWPWSLCNFDNDQVSHQDVIYFSWMYTYLNQELNLGWKLKNSINCVICDFFVLFKLNCYRAREKLIKSPVSSRTMNYSL